MENPYIAGNPVDDKRFFGRDAELQSIYDFVTKQDYVKVLLLKGEKRSGKTSILRKVERGYIIGQHNIKEAAEIVFCNFQHIVPKIESDEDLPLKIGEAITNVDKFREFHDDFLKWEGVWTEKLNKLTEECLKKIHPRKLVLLCDEHEALDSLFQKNELTSKALEWAKNMMKLRVYFIIAGGDDLGENLSLFSPYHPLIIHAALSKENAKQLITVPAEGILRYGDETIEVIYRLSGRQAFYIQYICNVLFKIITRANRSYVMLSDFDEAISFINSNAHGHIDMTWTKFTREQPENKKLLISLAHTLKDRDDYLEKNHPILLYKSGEIDWFKKNHLIEQKHDKSVRFKIDILREWIKYNNPYEEITQGKVEPDKHEEEPPVPGIMKWIPVVAVIVMLFVGWVVYKYVVPHKTPDPVAEIADIAGFEFIACDYDEKNIQRLYLFRKPAEKRLLLEKMKEPQKNPSISRDNQWLVFQSGGEADSKVIVANLRMRKTLDRKQQGKKPSISPDGTKIVYIKDSSMLTMELKNNGELSDTGPIELNLTHVDNPVYLYDNKSIAFIGAKDKDSRLSIFIYDTDGSFRYTHSDPGDKRIKEVTGTQSVEWLTASMNKSRILYSKDQKIYVKNLATMNEPETDAETDGELSAAFSVTDDIISIKNSRLVLWKVEEKPFRISTHNEISDLGFNNSRSIISLKGGRK